MQSCHLPPAASFLGGVARERLIVAHHPVVVRVLIDQLVVDEAAALRHAAARDEQADAGDKGIAEAAREELADLPDVGEGGALLRHLLLLLCSLVVHAPAGDPDIDTMPLLAWSLKQAQSFRELNADGKDSAFTKFMIKWQAFFYFPILLLARLSWLNE